MKRFARGFLLQLVISMGWMGSAPVYAQWSKLIDPGKLSIAHEKYQGLANCSKCHITTQGVPNSKCLDCHKGIAKVVRKKSGFHGKQKKTCAKCHSEHKGRNYQLAGLKRLKFKHKETGWPLTGKHAKLECVKCHSKNRVDVVSGKKLNRLTYLGLSSQCISCHTDIHQTKKSQFKKCADCHSTTGWGPIVAKPNFSHTKDTRFRLTGAHRKVKCYTCHKKKIWAPLPFKKCSNCHVDPHNGRFGPKCVDCHTTVNWQKTKNIKPTISKPKPKARVVVPPTSVVRPQITRSTKSRDRQISKSFDHQKTRFPLTGKHFKVDCKTCHGPKIGKIEKFDQCSDCHNNPHGTQFILNWKKKVCSNCHLTDGWARLNFDHTKDSRFPLVDKHKAVRCQDCHKSKTYRWKTTPACASCHKDVHRGQFYPKDCSYCHSVKTFNIGQFDHNRLTRFPLVGKHNTTPCAKCHTNKKYKPIETTCWTCHEDVHRGEFGKECVRCHTPTSFKDINFDHNRDSRFPLTGRHKKIACQDCHKNNRYKLGQLKCINCHTDIHKGTFGKTCERCHNTESFRVDSRFHDFGEFSLEGVHNRVNCMVCHGPQAPIRSGTAQCGSCHKDPHMNSFPQQCWQCHGQNAWVPSIFRHRQTGFELSGAHRFISCEQCHFNRVIGGLPQECSFCHLKDFDPVTPTEHQTSSTCDQCHRTYGWRPARP